MDGSKEQLVGFPKLVAILAAVWLLLGTLPAFAKMMHYDFLPSSEWTSKSNAPGLAVGVITAALVFLTLLKTMHRIAGGKAKQAGSVLITTLLATSWESLRPSLSVQ